MILFPANHSNLADHHVVPQSDQISSWKEHVNISMSRSCKVITYTRPRDDCGTNSKLTTLILLSEYHLPVAGHILHLLKYILQCESAIWCRWSSMFISSNDDIAAAYHSSPSHQFRHAIKLTPSPARDLARLSYAHTNRFETAAQFTCPIQHTCHSPSNPASHR